MHVVYIKRFIDKKSFGFFDRLPWSFDNKGGETKVTVISPFIDELYKNYGYYFILRGEEYIIKVKDKNFKVNIYEWSIERGKILFMVVVDGRSFGEFSYEVGENWASYILSKAFYLVVNEIIRDYDLLHILDNIAWFLPLFIKDKPIVTTITLPQADPLLKIDSSVQLELPETYFSPNGVEYYGKLSGYKTAIFFSKYIVIPGEKLIKSLLNEYKDDGRIGFLRVYQDKIVSLMVGIDYDYFLQQTKIRPEYKYLYSCNLSLNCQMEPGNLILLLTDLESFGISLELWEEIISELIIKFPYLNILLHTFTDKEEIVAYRLKAKFPHRVGFAKGFPLLELLKGSNIVLLPAHKDPFYLDYLSLATGNIIIASKSQFDLSNILKSIEPNLRIGNAIVYNNISEISSVLSKATYLLGNLQHLNNYVKRIITVFPRINGISKLMKFYQKILNT